MQQVFIDKLTVSPEEALAWHARPGAFERLTPPWMNVRVVESRGTLEWTAIQSYAVVAVGGAESAGERFAVSSLDGAEPSSEM